MRTPTTSTSIFDIIPRSGARTLLEDHSELADLHIGAVLQFDGIDELTAHIGSVQRSRVPQRESAGRADELGVFARDGAVIETDVRVRAAAHGHHIAVEQDLRARVRPWHDHEERTRILQTVEVGHRVDLTGVRIQDSLELLPARITHLILLSPGRVALWLTRLRLTVSLLRLVLAVLGLAALVR